jgi:hypothetical protein
MILPAWDKRNVVITTCLPIIAAIALHLKELINVLI